MGRNCRRQVAAQLFAGVLIVYSDSSHGAQYQHAKILLEHVELFLSDSDSPAAALDPISIKSSVVLGN